MDGAMPDLVDVHGAARILGLKASTVALYGALGRLPSRKIGRARVYDRAELEVYKQQRESTRHFEPSRG